MTRAAWMGAFAISFAPSLAGAQVEWRRIPAGDPANKLLSLIRDIQPAPYGLPEGSTYNYTWAQNMLAWMVAERSGLMSEAECSARLIGLLRTVEPYPTYHGFYYDKYDPATGLAQSNNVYFQGWWIWALMITKAGYPKAAPLADRILRRFNYVAAGIVSPDRKFLAADKNTTTGQISYYIQPTGDISGELRTAPFVYTWLTGDVTPWMINEPGRTIDVGGQPILAVWHHFTFDPFYVHSTFPEVGYFQKSYDNLVIGANRHRAENGMAFYATRMDPLAAWVEEPTKWPNTEHRVAKPWTAWLTDPNAPVMERAWVPGYGVTQYFDHWNFAWGTGMATMPHAKVVGGEAQGKFEATFELEILPSNVASTRPPKLTQIDVNVQPDTANPPTAPLRVLVNGTLVGSISPSSNLSLTQAVSLTPAVPIEVGGRNTVRLETLGRGVCQVGASAGTFRSVQWSDANHPSEDTSAIGLTVYVDGQRADRENPYAFLCRASGAFGNFPWKILAASRPAEFGPRMVAWVGPYSQTVRYAQVIHNVSGDAVTATYEMSPWDAGRKWRVVDFANPRRVLRSQQNGKTIVWRQDPHQTVRLVPAR